MTIARETVQRLKEFTEQLERGFTEIHKASTWYSLRDETISSIDLRKFAEQRVRDQLGSEAARIIKERGHFNGKIVMFPDRNRETDVLVSGVLIDYGCPEWAKLIDFILDDHACATNPVDDQQSTIVISERQRGPQRCSLPYC